MWYKYFPNAKELCVYLSVYINTQIYKCRYNVHTREHVGVHILSSNTKNQGILQLNAVCNFPVKIKIWQRNSVCRASNPLGKKPEELILERLIHCFFLLWKCWMGTSGAASPKACTESTPAWQGGMWMEETFSSHAGPAPSTSLSAASGKKDVEILWLWYLGTEFFY